MGNLVIQLYSSILQGDFDLEILVRSTPGHKLGAVFPLLYVRRNLWSASFIQKEEPSSRSIHETASKLAIIMKRFTILQIVKESDTDGAGDLMLWKDEAVPATWWLDQRELISFPNSPALIRTPTKQAGGPERCYCAKFDPDKRF